MISSRPKQNKKNNLFKPTLSLSCYPIHLGRYLSNEPTTVELIIPRSFLCLYSFYMKLLRIFQPRKKCLLNRLNSFWIDFDKCQREVYVTVVGFLRWVFGLTFWESRNCMKLNEMEFRRERKKKKKKKNQRLNREIEKKQWICSRKLMFLMLEFWE